MQYKKGLFDVIIIILVIFGFYNFFIVGSGKSVHGIDVIKELNENIIPNISAVEIYMRRDWVTENLCVRIKSKDELSVFSMGISNAEYKRHRGHTLPTSEVTLVIISDDDEHQYFGSILDKHPEDVFLEKSKWKDEGDGTLSKIYYGHFKVPGFATFMKEKLSTCQ